MVSVTQRKQ